MQKSELCSTKQPVTLKRLSDTRWACRVNSLIAVNSTLPAIVSTLEKIVDSDHDSRSMSEANGLLRKVCSFEFILSLTVLLDLLSYTKSLSDYLQRQDIDFVSAVQMHESLLSILTQKRSENSFDEYYSQAQEMSRSLGFEEQDLPPPKRRRISQRLDDTPSTQHHHLSGKSKFRTDFYYNTIDLMINALKRFNSESVMLLRGFSGLHPCRLNEIETMSKIKALAQFYEGDVNQDALKAEFEVFRHHQKITDCESVSEVLQLLNRKSLHEAYPNVTLLYRICLTLPVTTCSVERSFSKLKLVKSSIRSTMTETRLSSLLVLSVEQDITNSLDLTTIVNTFSALKSRRLTL